MNETFNESVVFNENTTNMGTFSKQKAITLIQNSQWMGLFDLKATFFVFFNQPNICVIVSL